MAQDGKAQDQWSAMMQKSIAGTPLTQGVQIAMTEQNELSNQHGAQQQHKQTHQTSNESQLMNEFGNAVTGETAVPSQYGQDSYHPTSQPAVSQQAAMASQYPNHRWPPLAGHDGSNQWQASGNQQQKPLSQYPQTHQPIQQHQNWNSPQTQVAGQWQPDASQHFDNTNQPLHDGQPYQIYSHASAAEQAQHAQDAYSQGQHVTQQIQYPDQVYLQPQATAPNGWSQQRDLSDGVTMSGSQELPCPPPNISNEDTPSKPAKDGGLENWADDPENPYNWSTGKKWLQVAMIGAFAITTSMATSIMAPAVTELQQEFDLTTTQSIAPVSVYTMALALGPVLGGPLSETMGRYFIYIGLSTIGGLFVLGTGFVQSFAGLCILRFLAGFFLGPTLAVCAGTLIDIFKPAERGLPSALFICTPFLGPGIAPLIGSFVVNRKGWRWTQWTVLFFLLNALLIGVLFGRETYAPVLKRKKAKKLGITLPPSPPLGMVLKLFLTISLLRPVRMLFTEPLVAFVTLYISCSFATLYSYFAAVPYVFGTVYHFGLESSGLIFTSVIVGVFLAFLTVVASDIIVYRPQIPKYAPRQVPPEWRLVPAMFASMLIPIGLFWFGWTSRPENSWASPAIAIVPFAWGNTVLFIAMMQYLTDVYHGTTVASVASANSLARYILAGAFPLFTVQMYERLGNGWASSLFGFITIALLPVPWVFFKVGPDLRAKSKYEVSEF